MKTFDVRIGKSAFKQLERIQEPFYSKIKRAIYGLSENSRPPGHKKLKGRDAYRIRVAEYRIIYEIHDGTLIVEVIEVGHRREIYR